jgi:hypothetical protein
MISTHSVQSSPVLCDSSRVINHSCIYSFICVYTVLRKCLNTWHMSSSTWKLKTTDLYSNIIQYFETGVKFWRPGAVFFVLYLEQRLDILHSSQIFSNVLIANTVTSHIHITWTSIFQHVKTFAILMGENAFQLSKLVYNDRCYDRLKLRL